MLQYWILYCRDLGFEGKVYCKIMSVVGSVVLQYSEIG